MTANPPQLPAALTLTNGDVAATPCDVDVHEFALTCPATVLASYAYADGVAHHAQLATHACGWLAAHGNLCTDALLAAHTQHPAAQLELAIEPATLRSWLATHRPHVLVCVLAAEVTASARWVRHDELVERITALPDAVAGQVLAALAAMRPDAAAGTHPEDFIDALLAASGPT